MAELARTIRHVLERSNMLRDFLTTTPVDQVAKGSSPPLDAPSFRLRIKKVVRILDGVLTMTRPRVAPRLLLKYNIRTRS